MGPNIVYCHPHDYSPPFTVNIRMEFFNRNVIPLNLMGLLLRGKKKIIYLRHSSSVIDIFPPGKESTSSHKVINRKTIITHTSTFDSQLIYNDSNCFITSCTRFLIFPSLVFLRRSVRRVSHHLVYELISFDVLLSSSCCWFALSIKRNVHENEKTWRKQKLVEIETFRSSPAKYRKSITSRRFGLKDEKVIWVVYFTDSHIAHGPAAKGGKLRCGG